VTLVATAAGIAGVVGPGYGAYSSIPGAGNAGRVYKDSDDPILWFDDGSAWHGTYNGTPIVQPPTSGNWTAIVTQTAATMAAFGSGLYIAGGSTTNWSSWYHTTGYSAPKTITAMVQINELPLRFIGVGIFLRLASSGKVVALEVINNNTVSSTQRGQLWSYEVDKWTFNGPSTTTFSATYQTDVLPPSHYHWLRLADTGGNIVSSYSIDGFNWIQLHSVSRTNWDAGGMDQTGIMVAGDIYTSGGVGYGNNAGASLLSWSET
jgi:hypothetical protein